MSEKRPQTTATLVKRLQRVAKRIDRYLEEEWAGTSDTPQWKARANTCWQAAARLGLEISDPPVERAMQEAGFSAADDPAEVIRVLRERVTQLERENLTLKPKDRPIFDNGK